MSARGLAHAAVVQNNNFADVPEWHSLLLNASVAVWTASMAAVVGDAKRHRTARRIVVQSTTNGFGGAVRPSLLDVPRRDAWLNLFARPMASTSLSSSRVNSQRPVSLDARLTLTSGRQDFVEGPFPRNSSYPITRPVAEYRSALHRAAGPRPMC